MKNIAILTPCITEGDAVSHDVMGMYNCLKKHGYKAQLFADQWHASNKNNIKHVSQVKSFIRNKEDILIYHYSVGWDIALDIINNINCNKIIKYHNVTPAEFYEGINADYVSVCRLGRAQLKLIADIYSALYLSDSEYNADELHSMGVSQENSLVLPPFHHIDDLQYIDADISVLDKYTDGKINILMVGRLAPNKGHSTLIDAFDVYHKNYNKNSRLIVVGNQDERLNIYTTRLYEKVKYLGLQESVIFTGGVSTATLKAYYLASNVFMITSEHEGFCVPLVESMAMKVPIVAYGSTAIPYTVGKAGLVWEQPDPYFLAGSVDCIASKESISATLGEMGWRRYQEIFTNEQIESKFINTIKSIE
ncbi:glycosyltransferase family 4 protein [Dendronalium sp. ChiSLP03b]|uniref:glycosyltransferase family 4 protein n=1 Tax=Dendronalium sp. ChiSLP03b TaxID=3075381 RepID=UPI002AD2DEDF|nr:glycosyltransferase family 4 protein [Dendronalium sp. ChiSLP03b]MDZ8208338.1 glycosyltransferase family 4 protein [Dendronalium sp. ChiSLP03b]